MEWYDFIKWLIIGCLIYRSTHKSSQKPSNKGLSKQEKKDKQKFEDFFK